MISEKKGNKLRYVCRKCGYTPREEKVEITSIEERLESKKDVVVFLSDEEQLKEYPIDKKVVCPECGKKGAYWFMQQTRSADEAPTMFYCCVHCKHKWREY